MTYDIDTARRLGLNEAITLSRLTAEAIAHNNDWFPITCEDLSDSTALSSYQVRQALQVLRDEGYVTSRRSGMPARLYFKLWCDK